MPYYSTTLGLASMGVYSKWTISSMDLMIFFNSLMCPSISTNTAPRQRGKVITNLQGQMRRLCSRFLLAPPRQFSAISSHNSIIAQADMPSQHQLAQIPQAPRNNPHLALPQSPSRLVRLGDTSKSLRSPYFRHSSPSVSSSQIYRVNGFVSTKCG